MTTVFGDEAFSINDNAVSLMRWAALCFMVSGPSMERMAVHLINENALSSIIDTPFTKAFDPDMY
jgi:hypothetical protein